MASANQLGRLERIRDIRSVWPDEARDFTPWLAQEENLALLSETIGIELECQSVEKAVGPFSADILCKDTVTDQYVLIENQIERTDHGHLGQLITYAAGLHAVTIVWVARRFTEEHRAAMNAYRLCAAGETSRPRRARKSTRRNGEWSGRSQFVRLPNADKAVVERSKLVDYLLNPEHADNGGKADFFAVLGFCPDKWRELADALRAFAQEHDITEMVESRHGCKYIVEGRINGPAGVSRRIRTVWIIEAAEDVPRLITAFSRRK